MENLTLNPEPRSQTVKVRCPQCFKLYAVKALEIHETKPKFECHQCKTRFWLAYPECLEQPEVMGFPVEWLETQLSRSVSSAPQSAIKTEKCPKCQIEHMAGQKECFHCGLIFEKYQAKEENRVNLLPPAHPDLSKHWGRVLEGYESETRHLQFLKDCQKKKGLDYASYQYGRILEINPSDERAQAMKDMILALTQTQLETTPTQKSAPEKIKAKWPRVSTVAMLIGFALIMVGFSSPQFKNLIGFGAAVLFLSLAIRYYRGADV